MEENDTLTYHVKRTSLNQEKTVDQSLISQERTQKLDLLMHLVANLTQSLVVCGPQGIGKTTLLKVLQERKVNSWLYCRVQGCTEVSFEKILEQIAEVMSPNKLKSDRSLSTVDGQHEGQNKKIILMIDDAGDLVPGLITTLIHYAAANPVLRLILVLTHDDLSLKNRTDRVIEDCHFVEIPPLSEKQCGVFLQHLATKPTAQIAFNSISDSLVENIYRETHGIPGRIIAKLPDLAKSRHSQSPTLILTLAVIGLVGVALAIQWFSASNNTNIEKAIPIKVDQKSGVIEQTPSQPKLSLKSEPLLLSEQYSQENNAGVLPEQQQINKPISKLNEAAGVTKNSGIAEAGVVVENKPGETVSAFTIGPKPDNKSQSNDLKNALPVNNLPSLSNSETGQQAPLTATENELASEEEALQEVAAPNDGVGWINSQPAESFTLQVMVLTKEQAIKDIIKKQQGLGLTLTSIKTVSPNGREKFLLLYGSYVSADLAYKARQSLPPEFRKSYARKFSSIKSQAGSIR